MNCGAFSLVGIEGARCGIYPMRCKKWGCPVCGVKSHDVCNSVASRLIDQLAINSAGLASFPSMTASIAVIEG
jgi:hypothetical protein